MEQWIIEELERTELGDKRRTKRLIKIRKTRRGAGPAPSTSIVLHQKR